MKIGFVRLSLSIFFMYFVLVGGACASLMQCGVRRFVDRSLWFKHLVAFASIAMFTYVLNWYSYDALVPQLGGASSTDPSTVPMPFMEACGKIGEWLGASALIYAAFLAMNKSDPPFFAAAMVVVVCITAAATLLKMVADPEQYGLVRGRLLLGLGEYDGANPLATVALHNLVCALFAALMFVLATGVLAYYKRQSADHRRDWSWITFVFGACRDLKTD